MLREDVVNDVFELRCNRIGFGGWLHFRGTETVLLSKVTFENGLKKQDVVASRQICNRLLHDVDGLLALTSFLL